MKTRAAALRTDINITPLIDIVLVLLIVFIVMVPAALTHAQRAGAAAPGRVSVGPMPELPRVLALGQDRYRLGAEELTGEAFQGRLASELVQRAPRERRVVLTVAPDAPLRVASQAMDRIHAAAGRIGETKHVRTILVEEKL